MKLPHPPRAVAGRPAAGRAPSWRRYRTELVRLPWIVLATTILVLFVVGVPARFGGLLQDAEEYRHSLRQLGLSTTFYAVYVTALDLIIVVTHLTIAAVIFWRRSDDWLASLVSVALVTTPVAVTHALDASYPGSRLLVEAINYLGLVSGITLLYLFPDGRFVPRRTRLLALAWAVVCLPAIFVPATVAGFSGWPLLPKMLVLSGWAGSGILAQVYRYSRVSSPLQRQQTKWAVFGLMAAALVPFAYFTPFLTLPSLSQPGLPVLFYQLAGPAFFTLSLLFRLVGFTLYTSVVLLFPISFAVAILRYGLWDIEILVNRTLVYTALTGIVIGVYVLVVGALGALFQARGSLLVSILATGLVAVLFQPLRARLQRGVNRLMYGERDDPAAVLSRLGQRLEATIATEAILTTIVETLVQALRLPYAAIALKQAEGFEIVVAHGRGGEEPEVIPLVHHGETIGQLMVSPFARGAGFTPADRRLMEDIARQAGAAVHAVRLTADLQRSRERLVTAREEERRRLRRDLHDSLGPQLASLTLKLDAVRNLMADDPAAAERLLLDLKQQAQTAIRDIRRLVYGLRPPALDELGLVAALREHAAHHVAGELQVEIEAPDPLPPLPAAVEVAAYRIAVEALTNVERHAGARRCLVQLSLNEALCVEVADDGVGLPANYHAGVGLMSMRERAAELGGACLVEPAPGGGTRVVARLPLPPAEESSWTPFAS